MPDHPGPGPGESASHRSDDLGRGSTTVSATPPTRLPFAQGLRKPAATVASASGAPNLTGRRAGRCAAPFAYKQSRFRGGPRRVALLKTDRLSREPDEPVVAPLVAKEWPAQATAGRCSVADPLVSSDYSRSQKQSRGAWAAGACLMPHWGHIAILTARPRRESRGGGDFLTASGEKPSPGSVLLAQFSKARSRRAGPLGRRPRALVFE